jgi:L-cystine transport system substrate-binding protein
MLNFKKTVSLWLAALMLALTLSACGNSSQQQGGESSADKPTEVIIGMGADFSPLSFYNEKKELDGFEKDLLDEIDARLPQYTFSYKTFDFTNILLALESGKIDAAVHLFEYNIERAAKFLYGTEGYTHFDLYLIVRDTNDSITTLEDLKGKKLLVQNNAGNSYYVSNKWNEEHGKPFEIIFEPTTPLTIEDLETGVADAALFSKIEYDGWIREYDAKIKIVGGVVNESETFILFNKETGTEFQKAFDGALKEIKENGSWLSDRSVKWLQNDISVKPKSN